MGPLALIGQDCDIWGSIQNPKGYRHDLVGLKPRRKNDPFSRVVCANAVHLFRCGLSRIKNPSQFHGTVGYEDTSVKRLTRCVSNIVASLMPILSIVILYNVSTIQAKLGIIAAFNVLMSACISVFTNARRSEVFAVASA